MILYFRNQMYVILHIYLVIKIIFSNLIFFIFFTPGLYCHVSVCYHHP